MSQGQELPLIEIEKPRNKRTRAFIIDGKLEIRWGRGSKRKAFREKFRKEVLSWARKKLARPDFSLEQTVVREKPRAATLGGQFRVYQDERAEQSLRTLKRVKRVLDVLAEEFGLSYGRLNESRARSYRGLSHKKNNISLRLYHPATLEPLSYSEVIRTAIHELAHNHPRARGHGRAWKSVELEMLDFAARKGLLGAQEEAGGPGEGENEQGSTGRELDRALGRLPLPEARLVEKQVKEILNYGPKPALTVDGIVVNRNQEILLIRRKNPPFQGSYALPGGFVDYGEAVEVAIVREMKEETSLNCAVDRLVGVYSKPGRDPRGHTVSAVFALKILSGTARSGDDAAEVRWFPLHGELPDLAFDHGQVVEDFRAHFLRKRGPGEDEGTIQTTLRLCP